jgi:CubicO group peptidase (beta-lactamase class C family)
MLATVIAMLVEEGKLNWDTKAADVLEIPRANGLRTNEITLKQLLNHHAGLPPFEDDSASEWKAWKKERPSSGSSADRVQQFAQWLLQRPTIGAPAVKFVYSNRLRRCCGDGGACHGHDVEGCYPQAAV